MSAPEKKAAAGKPRELKKSERKIDLKEVDMPEEMVRDAVELAKYAVDNFQEKEVRVSALY